MDYLYDEGADTFRIEVAGAGFPLRAPPMPSHGALSSGAVHQLRGSLAIHCCPLRARSVRMQVENTHTGVDLSELKTGFF